VRHRDNARCTVCIPGCKLWSDTFMMAGVDSEGLLFDKCLSLTPPTYITLFFLCEIDVRYFEICRPRLFIPNHIYQSRTSGTVRYGVGNIRLLL